MLKKIVEMNFVNKFINLADFLTFFFRYFLMYFFYIKKKIQFNDINKIFIICQVGYKCMYIFFRIKKKFI